MPGRGLWVVLWGVLSGCVSVTDGAGVDLAGPVEPAPAPLTLLPLWRAQAGSDVVALRARFEAAPRRIDRRWGFEWPGLERGEGWPIATGPRAEGEGGYWAVGFVCDRDPTQTPDGWPAWAVWDFCVAVPGWVLPLPLWVELEDVLVVSVFDRYGRWVGSEVVEVDYAWVGPWTWSWAWCEDAGEVYMGVAWNVAVGVVRREEGR